jgi:uncharacterized coiled-coil protein SlyX
VGAIEERVALLEGRMIEQAQLFNDIRDALARLERRVDAGFERVDARIDAVRKDASVDFRWIFGIQITTLIAVVAALLGR